MFADAAWLNESLEIWRANTAQPVPVSQMQVSTGVKWESIFK
jgi:hypothetical protein